MHEGARLLPVLAFNLIRERCVVVTTSEATSCAQLCWFWRLFNVRKRTCQPHRNLQQEQRSLMICWRAWIVLPWVLHVYFEFIFHGLAALSSFAERGLHAYTLPPPQWAHIDRQKTGSRLIGQWKGLVWVLAGRGERQMVHSTSSLLKWVAVIMLVINTAGLRDDYTFCSGLQAWEIQLGSPDRFPCERCGLSTRLGKVPGLLFARRQRVLSNRDGQYITVYRDIDSPR